MTTLKSQFKHAALLSALLLCHNSGYAQQQIELGTPETTKPKVLGILGGGQLGRMLALSAANLGIKVKVLDPSSTPPAGVAAETIQGSFRDAQNVQDFASQVDVLTVEIEHVDAPTLMTLSAQGMSDIQPAANTIAVIQDKFSQKKTFSTSRCCFGRIL